MAEMGDGDDAKTISPAIFQKWARVKNMPLCCCCAPTTVTRAC